TFALADEGVRIAWAWNNLSQDGSSLSGVQRYARDLERSLIRRINLLRKLQNERLQNDSPAAPEKCFDETNPTTRSEPAVTWASRTEPQEPGKQSSLDNKEKDETNPALSQQASELTTQQTTQPTATTATPQPSPSEKTRALWQRESDALLALADLFAVPDLAANEP
ncbi:MAG: hypothetical protein H7Y20_18440, partial [Bryobacteraceae bacterium]|nr:hypothetical protein [Bryobacteraceae bacterium]